METESDQVITVEAATVTAGTRDMSDLSRLPVVRVPVNSVIVHDSPRLSGEDPEHTRRLAGSGEALPPILVHHPSMHVIDGAHRLAAAKLRGHQNVEARFVAGDEADLFILAVRSNIAHGLPLTLAERKAAAQRIIALRPHWSDRMIASASGLSASSVAAQRSCPDDRNQQFDTRIGKDGRVRPVNSAARKELAVRLLAAQPNASLREIAREAGLSHETVRHVRLQLRAPADPVSPATAGAVPAPESPGAAPKPAGPGGSWEPLNALRSDPAFRSSETGRFLTRLMLLTQALSKESGRFVTSIPPHCLGRVTAIARVCGQQWLAFADGLEERERTLDR